jgi:hypothetical protein
MKQEPPVFRSGALRGASLSVYLLGGFPPRGALPKTAYGIHFPASV